MDNMFFLTVQFLSTLGCALFWYKILQWSPEESICMAILSSISLVMIGGYFGYAQISMIVFFICAALGVLLAFWSKVKYNLRKNGEKEGNFFTPAVILLVLCYIYGVIAFQGLVINNWDEMHHWGKAVRYMLDYNVLPSGDHFDGSEILLSSTTVFHYFFCKIASTMTGEIVESNMYVSNLILWFSAAILPLSGMGWKQWKSVLCYGLTIFLSMNLLFVQPYFNIYCDQPVSIWAGALIAWLIFCEEKRYHRVLIVLALMHISFMKSMVGPLFAVIVLLVLFIKYITDYEKKFKETLTCLRQDLSIRRLLYGIVCVCSVFVLTVIWSIHIDQNALIRVDSAANTGTDRFALTLESGLSKWFTTVSSYGAFPQISFFLALVFTILISIWFSEKYLVSKTKKQYQILSGFYVVGFLGFFALMIYSYMTTFMYEDSIVTGSLNRYFSGYIMLGLVPIVMPAFRNQRMNVENILTSSQNTITVGAVVLLVFFVLGTTNGFYSKAFGADTKENNFYKARIKLELQKEVIIDQLMDDSERIYMINQDPNGVLTVAADYVFDKLIDRSGMCYYFTKTDQQIAGLSYTRIRNLPEILINGYGYLWIYKTDDYIKDSAFSVLKIKTPENGDFYKVENNNGHLKLNYLGNVEDIIDGMDVEK